MTWWNLLFLTLGLLILGCSASKGTPDISEGKTVVFEGLPHPMYEDELLESEKQTKAKILLHGSYFYEKFQDAKDTETNELRNVLSDPEGFTPFEGEKKCGGFHADYAVAWKVNGQVFEILICFGCGEVKRYGPRGEVREDMKQQTRENLKMILKMYDNVRPPHKMPWP